MGGPGKKKKTKKCYLVFSKNKSEVQYQASGRKLGKTQQKKKGSGGRGKKPVKKILK